MILLGEQMPISRNQIQNLARMFIDQRPYETRNESEIANTMVLFSEGIGNIAGLWEQIANKYTAVYGETLP